MLLRPGPYVCAEWDFGGLPPYLLRDPELKVRCLYPRYMHAAERYIERLAAVVRPLLVTRGGPILMVQIENEYGSYGNDRAYMARLKDVWLQRRHRRAVLHGRRPDAATCSRPATSPGAAVGLDSGSNEKHWELARSIVPGVPVFSSETYPGWLTHWGEKWARPSLDDLLKEVAFLLGDEEVVQLLRHPRRHQLRLHGGRQLRRQGLRAGRHQLRLRRAASTSRDGRRRSTTALRDLIAGRARRRRDAAARSRSDSGHRHPGVPDGGCTRRSGTTCRRRLPSVQPQPFEMYGQNQGLVLYRTTLVGRKSGRLVITDLHDYATVFVDGKHVGHAGSAARREDASTCRASTNPMPVLEILVEGMGHINFAQAMIDRKGITDRVTLAGMTLMNWEVFSAPARRRDGSRRSGRTRLWATRPGHVLQGHVHARSRRPTPSST